MKHLLLLTACLLFALSSQAQGETNPAPGGRSDQAQDADSLQVRLDSLLHVREDLQLKLVRVETGILDIEHIPAREEPRNAITPQDVENVNQSLVIVPFMSAVVAAIIALLGVWIGQFLTGRREKREYKCTRLERAYLLCQKLYDGHKAEIAKVKIANHTISSRDWLQQRNHPGEHMNEIKMIVSMYAPGLQENLDEMDKGHQLLKDRFDTIDNKFSSGVNIDLSNQNLISNLESFLSTLGTGMNVLKEGLGKAVRKA